MAQPVARIGDSISHGGAVAEGSSVLMANGIAVARVGDKANCVIHGLVLIIDGNPNWKDGGKDVARVGSQCSCGAVITAGSPNVFSRN